MELNLKIVVYNKGCKYDAINSEVDQLHSSREGLIKKAILNTELPNR